MTCQLKELLAGAQQFAQDHPDQLGTVASEACDEPGCSLFFGTLFGGIYQCNSCLAFAQLLAAEREKKSFLQMIQSQLDKIEVQRKQPVRRRRPKH